MDHDDPEKRIAEAKAAAGKDRVDRATRFSATQAAAAQDAADEQAPQFAHTLLLAVDIGMLPQFAESDP